MRVMPTIVGVPGRFVHFVHIWRALLKKFVHIAILTFILFYDIIYLSRGEGSLLTMTERIEK